MYEDMGIGDMSKNRVEQLESTVAELESAVAGLTDELVEAKERIRVLEAELDTETPTRIPERRDATGTDDGRPGTKATADPDANEGSESETTDETEESRGDDIIVA